MVGRKKNLIILGTGENVSPEELERKLNACPEVQECVVKEMGKRIGAQICCAEEKQAEVRAFITGLNRTLPLYGGVQHRAPAPQRHGQAAAQVSAEIVKKAQNRAACVLHFLHKTGIIKHRNAPPAG